MTALLTFRKEHILTLLGTLVVFFLDTLSKAYIVQHLSPGDSIPVIPGVFHITRMQNTGAAFSMFYQHPELLTLVAGILFLLFTGFMLSKNHLNRAEICGFSLILGGALGNLLDRIRVGAVTDFLDFTIIHYPVFNLADSFILIGVLLLFIDYVRHYNHPSHS